MYQVIETKSGMDYHYLLYERFVQLHKEYVSCFIAIIQLLCASYN